MKIPIKKLTFKSICNHIKCFRLQPIQIFVFHQVSDTFDPLTMWECDWTETTQFKNNILKMKQEYEFIPLTEAYTHLKKDWFRHKKYAAMTCDDGWASIKSIIPWLAEQSIHTTLFLNPAYLKREQIRENNMAGLLNAQEVKSLLNDCKGFIAIGSHGWNHDDCHTQTTDAFIKSVLQSDRYLSEHFDSYVRFFAYPCGRHTHTQDEFLLQNNYVPVYCDGQKNLFDNCVIHRECIDHKSFTL